MFRRNLLFLSGLSKSPPGTQDAGEIQISNVNRYATGDCTLQGNFLNCEDGTVIPCEDGCDGTGN